MKEMLKWCGAAALGLSFLGCGAADAPDSADEPEAVGSDAQAVLGTTCSGSVQTNCWSSFSGPNYRAFTFRSGLGCAIKTSGSSGGTYTYKQIWCATSGTDFNLPVGHTPVDPNVTPPLEAPADLKSVATEYVPNSMRIYGLGQDNVIYRSGSTWPSSNWFNGFKTYSTYAQPVDNVGNQLCLKKIDVVYVGNFQSPPSPDLLALSCDGKLYYSGLQGTARVWFPVANKLPWSLLNGNTITKGPYKDFGHANTAGDPYPLYLLTTGGDVVSIGRWTFSSSGARTWHGPSLLSAMPNGLKPIAIGGPFVITNAGNGVCTAIGQPCNGDNDRFYFFDFPSQAWTRLNIGTRALPVTPDDVAAGDPHKGVVDASAFTTSNGRQMGIWQHNHRVYSYAWP
jgi:hypothetical protein